jgi:hypothetical protein
MTDEQENIEIEEPRVESEDELDEDEQEPDELVDSLAAGVEEMGAIASPPGEEISLPAVAAVLASHIADDVAKASVQEGEDAEPDTVVVAVLYRLDDGRERYTWLSNNRGWSGTLALTRRIAAELEGRD